jgi:group I intron endonuclease
MSSILNFFNFSKAGLYVITCIPLSKHYVGETDNITRRLNAHKSDLRRNCHHNQQLQADYNQWGVDQFFFQKLLFGAGFERKQRQDLETVVLLTLSSEQRYNLYTNWRKRGRSTNPFYRKKHTKEAREAISDSLSGRPSSFKGKEQSNEVKLLISQQNKGGSNKERRKPLYIEGVFYESVSAASQEAGLARRLIRERCNSEDERWKSFQWAKK